MSSVATHVAQVKCHTYKFNRATTVTNNDHIAIEKCEAVKPILDENLK